MSNEKPLPVDGSGFRFEIARYRDKLGFGVVVAGGRIRAIRLNDWR